MDAMVMQRDVMMLTWEFSITEQQHMAAMVFVSISLHLFAVLCQFQPGNKITWWIPGCSPGLHVHQKSAWLLPFTSLHRKSLSVWCQPVGLRGPSPRYNAGGGFWSGQEPVPHEMCRSDSTHALKLQLQNNVADCKRHWRKGWLELYGLLSILKKYGNYKRWMNLSWEYLFKHC